MRAIRVISAAMARSVDTFTKTGLVVANVSRIVGLLAVSVHASGIVLGVEPVVRPNTAGRQVQEAKTRPTSGPSQRITAIRRPTCGDGNCEERLGESFGNCPGDCEALDHRASYLKSVLETEFVVDEGVFRVYEAADCDQLEQCFFNNATSRYGVFQIPLGPGEPDPDPDNRGLSSPGLTSVYRLLPDEALLWVGTLPPESPYFSFAAYVFSRFDPEAIGEPPYDDRAGVFASLGDPQNDITLRTTALPGQSPFGKESLLIVTSDQGTDRAIRDLLGGTGFSDSIANTLVIPRVQADDITPMVRMGYDNEADLFTVLVRIAHPDAELPDSEIHAWLEDPGSRVFRLRPRVARRLDPFPLPRLRVPGSGDQERGASLRRLVRRIQAQYSVSDRDTKIAIAGSRVDGYFCLEHMISCMADCRDTPYMALLFRLSSEQGALIVAGYNHERSGKARYVNITATRVNRGKAYYSVVMRDLIGSAEVYLPSDPDAADLWQLKFARSCEGEAYCFEITEEQLASDEIGMVIVRAYLDPGTGTKPKMLPKRDSELVYPRALHLTR